ncbi:alkaline phosphatase [Suttonella sp. R2A3]|uniref:alkaline phosphatase n=1 Tax=Suttonella sp. R2A3 TaxID=2908648 RepID=UPI001F428CD0|nr:alkaline phosphatase [Suttonella sp. R2A3]UJF24379.1 alkaline phosphatase [Suttonella sp. R2A3]
MRLSSLAVIISAALAAQAQAATIFPLDRATILAGSYFDVKVEFDQEIKPEDVNISVNGQPLQDTLKGDYQFIAQENGTPASTVWLRNVAIKEAGDYTLSVSEGDKESKVSWSVFASPQEQKAKNIIFFVGDGMSVANRTGARILSKGVYEGKANGRLAMDQMPYMAMIGTSSQDTIASDSANTMSAYLTGHKSAVNAMGVYLSRSEDNLDHPRQEPLGLLVRRVPGMKFGVVSDAEVEDATPGAMVAQTRRRGDKDKIVGMFYNAQPDVLLGGGSAYFLPQTTPGSKRKDDTDFIQKFTDAGYQVVTNNSELTSIGADTTKLLGLFNTGNMDGVYDRRFAKNEVTAKFPDQPDLTTMTQTALDVLSKDNEQGFVLVVESARIDKDSHPLDWERSFMNTIMLDQSIAIAQEFAEKNPDTMIVVTADHTHGIGIIGTVDDEKEGEMRDKVGTYDEAGYPNYTDADGDGYPDDLNVSKRLAVFYNNFPDHYETYRPKLDGVFVPAVKNENGQYAANEQYKDAPGAQLRIGNLPKDADSGVHAVDDVILTAQGPGAENYHGYMENTDSFKVITDALALSNRLQDESSQIPEDSVDFTPPSSKAAQ